MTHGLSNDILFQLPYRFRTKEEADCDAEYDGVPEPPPLFKLPVSDC